jgi:diguanylate cyclase
MYRAKLSGKNDVRFYSPAMNAAAEERLEIASHLSSAMEDGELHLNFQPQWGTLTGRIESFEALLRWYNPDLGSVSPARLIPIAEESGLMVAIGNWVLNESCRQASRWTAITGERIGVSVNISASQFDRDDFVDAVSSALDEHKLVPSQLELELNESAIVENVQHAAAKMEQLRTLGVRIAMDDFGLGSSSLSNLVRLPLDTVKIDRAFVRDLHETSVSDRVIQAIVALTSGIGLDVVAEGIETEAQRERVVALGCKRMQGFLLGAPASAEATLELLQRPCYYAESFDP